MAVGCPAAMILSPRTPVLRLETARVLVSRGKPVFAPVSQAVLQRVRPVTGFIYLRPLARRPPMPRPRSCSART